MAIMTHAKFHFNWLMLTLIFGIWAFEPPGPGERLKRPGLIGLKAKIIIINTFFIITNFKTYRYLNNFQEHLFRILRLRKYQTLLQNFFPT